MAWYDGELFPVGKEFANAPVGAMLRNEECTHDHVVGPKHLDDGPPITKGRMCLFCVDCESLWWEDVALIVGSPWAVAK